ncbi:MAG: 3-deoxy-D-manno-octulosonic acid transferase [Candidatus Omnitrophota bacterium]|jgi:3-deoxy-D-manno-octulosonic-acid transferase
MSNLVFFIYDLIFIIGLIIYLPFYAWRKKITFSAFKQKMGFLGKVKVPYNDSIWIQVVSVGEVNLIENLVERIHELFDYNLVITTTTLSGNKLAQKKYAQLAKILYFPFDISFVINRLIRFIRPKIFIAIETEIWPNLFHCLKKHDIPVVIINARISEKAFKHYKLFRPIIGNILKTCDYIGAQNLKHKSNFLYLGADENNITVTGNMKFNSIHVDEMRLQTLRNKYLHFLKTNNSLLIVAGSTHPPEETILLNLYNKILTKTENVTLVIAPRHIERVPAIEKIITASGLNPTRISNLSGYNPQKRNVFILDTIGELLYFYSFADICFVGGSLAKYGGHNILEPIFFSKPTVFGPDMDNFKDIEEVILSKKAGIKITDETDMENVLFALLNDKKKREELRLNCLDVFAGEKKVLEENLKIILKCIK